MQVFKVYNKILKKQMVSILIYAALFFWITIMISSSRNNENAKFEPSKVKITVVNEDGQSDLIDGFLKHMEKYVEFVEIDNNEDARKDALFFRKVVYILTIPKGFTEGFLTEDEAQLSKQIIPDSVEAITVDSAIDNYFNMVNVYLKHAP